MLSMKVGAELAINLPETRRHGCWLLFLPLFIEVQRLLLSRRRASYAAFPRLAPDVCRYAHVTPAMLRRAIERAELVSHPGLGEVHNLLAVGRSTNGSADVAKLTAMAGVRTRWSRFCPYVVTNGTGIVFTWERPADAAEVTAAQAHQARRLRGGNETKSGGGVTSMEHQAAVMGLPLDSTVKKCVVGVDPGVNVIYSAYSLGLDPDLVVVPSPHVFAYRSERA